MKKTALYFLSFTLFLLGGCKKYLEKEPDNRANLFDPTKVSELLGSAYPPGNYMGFAEAMSDNAGDKGTGAADPVNRGPYYFENVQSVDMDSPDYYWYACYEAIAAANQALDACNKAADPESYKSQKGEALVARAYAHFMLVTFYAKPYNTTTSSSDAGIPYVTEPETIVNKQYSRGTVAQVYEMIEKDLIEGIPLLDDSRYTIPKYHFTRTAANAFAARFYLFKRDYEKVVQYASAAIPTFQSSLRAWNTTYQTYGINNLPAQYQKASDPANLLLITVPSVYCYGNQFVFYRYGLTTYLQDLILGNSIAVTGGAWSFIKGYVGSQSNPAIPKFNYTDFALETPTATYGTPYGTICLFTAEEVLFNKAEANAYLGNYDGAINDLNTYMSTRITGVTPGSLPSNRRITQTKVRAHYNNSFNIQDALVLYILELRRAEFIHEGMRWLDILRNDIPVTHYFTGPGGTDAGSIEIDATDKRRQLKLPDEVKLSGITDLNR